MTIRGNTPLTQKFVQVEAKKAYDTLLVFGDVWDDLPPTDFLYEVITRMCESNKLHSLYFLNRLNNRDPQVISWIREELAK